MGFDDRGKVRLSMRVVDQETGAELEDTRPAREPRERGDREGGRGGDRRRDGGRGGERDRGPRRDRGDRNDRPARSESKDEGGENIGLPAFLTGGSDD